MTTVKKTKAVKASPAIAKNLIADFVQKMRDGFETDVSKETESGTDISFAPYGIFVCRRAIGRNAGYAAQMRDKVIPYLDGRPELKAGEKDAIGDRLMAEVYAETIIVGLKTSDGQVIEYDAVAKDYIVTLLIELPDVFSRLQNEVVGPGNFRAKRIEADSKN